MQVHNGERKACPVCGKVLSDLWKHMRTVHGQYRRKTKIPKEELDLTSNVLQAGNANANGSSANGSGSAKKARKVKEASTSSASSSSAASGSRPVTPEEVKVEVEK